MNSMALNDPTGAPPKWDYRNIKDKLKDIFVDKENKKSLGFLLIESRINRYGDLASAAACKSLEECVTPDYASIIDPFIKQSGELCPASLKLLVDLICDVYEKDNEEVYIDVETGVVKDDTPRLRRFFV